MKFLPFIAINDYPVSDKKRLIEVLSVFFNTPRLKGYFDAIARSSRPARQANINLLLKNFVEVIVKERNKNNPEGYLKLMKALESTNVGLFSNRAPLLLDTQIKKHYSPIFFNVVTKKAIFEKQRMIQSIEYFVNQYGTAALEIEHKKAMKYFTSFELLSFDEYLTLSWQDVDCKAVHLKPTLLQWKSYLSYVNLLVSPYAEAPLHTENRKQAIAVGEKIKTIIGKLEKMENRLVNYSTKLFNIQEEMRLNRRKWVLYQAQLSQLEKKHAEPLSERIAEDQELLQALIMSLELTYEDLALEHSHLQTIVNKSMALYCTPSGELDRESELVKLIQPELNYWRDNLPRIAMRQADIKELNSFSIKHHSKNHDNLNRFITLGELNCLKELKQFSQSQTASLEREKWFFGSKASPGSGVTHPYRCEIQLKSGSIALLGKLSKSDGQYATVVKKENEFDCIGIHEDALPSFNSMINKVIVYHSAGMNKAIQAEIDFSKNENSNLRHLCIFSPSKEPENEGLFRTTQTSTTQAKKV